MSHVSLHGLDVIVGEENCLTDPAVCAEFAVDGMTPHCAVFPRSEDEAARVLKRSAEYGLAVIPSCRATKLAAGGVPRKYDVALNLRHLNEVRHFEPGDLTVSVGPGVELGEFQRFLQPRRLWIPFDPPGAGNASLGGTVAANASGPLRLKYGTPRDSVLGMKIAAADGKIIKTGGQVVKNVAGYDLSRLLTGSYGTLGVIVEISLKLFPLPSAQSTWRATMASLEAAHEFRRKLLQSPLSPSRMVLLDGGAAAFAGGCAPEDPGETGNRFEIWVEFSGSDRVLARSAQTFAELADAAGMSAGALDEDTAGPGWDRIVDASSLMFKDCEHLVALKATLPITSGESFVEHVTSEAKRLGVPCACFCQNGTGVVRACLLPEAFDPGLAAAVTRLRAQAVERGGSLIIERCPSEMKRHVDVWGPAGSDFALMHKLKELWDPKGVLSPGRFVGGL